VDIIAVFHAPQALEDFTRSDSANMICILFCSSSELCCGSLSLSARAYSVYFSSLSSFLSWVIGDQAVSHQTVKKDQAVVKDQTMMKNQAVRKHQTVGKDQAVK